MKKLITLVLAAAMLASLCLLTVSCNRQGGETTPAPSANSSSAPVGSQEPSQDAGSTLYLLNWGDYIDPEIKEAFRRETGITVKETPVTSNEEMIIKLEADDCPYDLCIPSDYAVERLISKNRLAEINYDNIPNIKNIDPKYMELSTVFDPGNKHSVPYTWGVLGIMYNKKMVDEADIGRWDLLWNEKYAQKIIMYDSVRDSMAAALCKLGYDLNTTEQAEIDAAADELIKVHPLVRAWLTDDVKESMIGGAGAAALVYSGDAVWCMEPEEGSEDLDFYVPEEGSNIYFDNMVIPVNSPRKELAEKFINFLLDAEIAAQNTEFIGYSSPNTAVNELIDEFFTGCSAYNISAQDIARCKIFRDLGDKIELYNNAWDRVFK